jgi:hypothetical protein
MDHPFQEPSHPLTSKADRCDRYIMSGNRALAQADERYSHDMLGSLFTPHLQRLGPHAQPRTQPRRLPAPYAALDLEQDLEKHGAFGHSP